MSPFAEVSIVSMSFKSVLSFSFLTVITVNLASYGTVHRMRAFRIPR